MRGIHLGHKLLGEMVIKSILERCALYAELEGDYFGYDTSSMTVED
jgi:hypothetical protein